MRIRRLVVLLVATMLAATAPVSAYQRPSSTVEVTVSTSGVRGDGEPDACSSSIACDAYVDMTPSGRYVAFHTSFTNLVPGDTNGEMDVFVRDLQLQTTERLSVAWDGAQANGSSGAPSISDDGRYVTFVSDAPNLVPGGTTGEQIFVRDRIAGTTTLVSAKSDGSAGAGTSGNAEISGDGRLVAFWSSSFTEPYTGLRTRGGEVYVRDLVAGTTERIAKTETGDETEGVETYRSAVSINEDGRIVAWETRHHNVTPGDVNGNVDIFVRDRQGGTTERVSVNDAGEGANWASYSPKVSADGRFVVFSSFATNLVPTDGNGRPTGVLGGGVGIDVFVRDRELGTTRRVNVSSAGVEDDQGGDFPTISADGRFIAFTSSGTTLAPGATDYGRRVYRHDRLTGETVVASVPAPGGHTQTAFVGAPALSGDGAIVSYVGDSANSPFAVAAYATTLGGALDVTSASVLEVPAGLQVSGTFAVSGAVASSATSAGGSEASAFGADLVDARVLARPESEDVLIEIEPSTLPSVSTMTPGTNYVSADRAEVPAARYEVSFLSGGSAYLVQAGLDPVSGVGARFSLSRCTPGCSPIASLTGSWGDRGTLIAVMIPHAILPLATITDLEVSAQLVASVPSPVATPTDRLELGDAEIDAPTVHVGVALPGEEPSYLSAASLTDGAFAATISSGDVPQQDYEVWARICFAGSCRERLAG